jgi:hypothetical protein
MTKGRIEGRLTVVRIVDSNSGAERNADEGGAGRRAETL